MTDWITLGMLALIPAEIIAYVVYTISEARKDTTSKQPISSNDK